MNLPDSDPSSPGPSGLQVETAGHRSWQPRLIWAALVALAIVLTLTVWLAAQTPTPIVGALVASPSGYTPTTPTAIPNIVVNTPTVVTFTVFINAPTLNPPSVQLERVDPSGALLSVVGPMNDTGKNSDVKSGDNIFTAQITLNEPSIGRFYFRVGAAFTGNTVNAWSTIVPLDVDLIRLPPDPGAAGQTTVQGIDFDADGVRDDVQRYIVLNYLSSARATSALLQYAKGVQSFILDSSDRVALQADLLQKHRTADCLEYVFSAAGNQSSDVLAVMLDTPARLRAHALAETNLGSVTYSLSGDDTELKDGCDFSPDSLPD